VARAYTRPKGQRPTCRVHAARAWGKEGIGRATGANHGWGGVARRGGRGGVRQGPGSQHEHLNAVLQSSVKRGRAVISNQRGGGGGEGGCQTLPAR